MARTSAIAELAAVAEQARTQAPMLAATFAGCASDCVWKLCAYVAATAFGNRSSRNPPSTNKAPGGDPGQRLVVSGAAPPAGVTSRYW